MIPLGVSFPSRITASTASRSLAGSMLYVSSQSTKTGVAPTKATLSPVAKNVNDGTKTASDSFKSIAIKGIVSASVPLAQENAYFLPVNSASLRSISSISGPMINC